MELLFLVIILIVFLAANWVANNMSLIITIIVALFAINIIRDIIYMVKDEDEYAPSKGRMIFYIILKIIACIGVCLLLDYIF